MRVLSQARLNAGADKFRSKEVDKGEAKKKTKKFDSITFEYISPSKIPRKRAPQVMVPTRSKVVRRLMAAADADADVDDGEAHFDDDYRRVNEEDARGRSEKAATWVLKHCKLFSKSHHPYEESLKQENTKKKAKSRGH